MNNNDRTISIALSGSVHAVLSDFASIRMCVCVSVHVDVDVYRHTLTGVAHSHSLRLVRIALSLNDMTLM